MRHHKPKMTKQEIEVYLNDILEKVELKSPIEDMRVELKSEFIPAEKAARQIAGHANSLNGQTGFWVFGIDEKAGKVTGVNHAEFSSWHLQLKKHFDSVTPEIREYVFDIQNVTIIVLIIYSDTAPYVTKNPRFGHEKGDNIEFEVPIRKNTRVTSASRSDLLRLLLPTITFPELEILFANCRLNHITNRKYQLYFYSNLYFYKPVNERSNCTLPLHKSNCIFRIIDTDIEFSLDNKILENSHSFSKVISTKTEIILTGPGSSYFTSFIDIEDFPFKNNYSKISIQLNFYIHELSKYLTKNIILENNEKNKNSAGSSSTLYSWTYNI